MTINGLQNRLSTARGTQPYQEVFFETFEPSGQHQVDFSGYMEFSDELVPGTINLVYDSMVLSDDKVGQ